MSGRSLVRFVLAAVLVGLLSGCAPPIGTRSPTRPLGESSWRTLQHDFQHTGQSLARGPSSPALDWSFDTQAMSASGAIVDRYGRIYVAAQKSLYAVNVDGEKLWAFPVPEYASDSSPSLDRLGNVYFTSARGNIFSLDSHGRLRWRLKTATSFDEISSPVIDSRSNAYVVGNSTTAGLLVSVSAAGKLRWQRRLPQISGLASAPDGSLVVSCGDRLARFSPMGRLLWNVPLSASSVPVVDRHGRTYVSSGPGANSRLTCLSLEGKQLWSVRLREGPVVPALDVGGGVSFIDGVLEKADQPDNYALYRLDKRGRRVLRVPVQGVGTIPIIDQDGTVFLGFDSGLVAAISKEGRRLWSYDWTSSHSSPPIAPVMAMDRRGRLIFVTASDVDTWKVVVVGDKSG